MIALTCVGRSSCRNHARSPQGMQLFQLQNCPPIRAMKIAAEDKKFILGCAAYCLIYQRIIDLRVI